MYHITTVKQDAIKACRDEMTRRSELTHERAERIEISIRSWIERNAVLVLVLSVLCVLIAAYGDTIAGIH